VLLRDEKLSRCGERIIKIIDSPTRPRGCRRATRRAWARCRAPGRPGAARTWAASPRTPPRTRSADRGRQSTTTTGPRIRTRKSQECELTHGSDKIYIYMAHMISQHIAWSTAITALCVICALCHVMCSLRGCCQDTAALGTPKASVLHIKAVAHALSRAPHATVPRASSQAPRLCTMNQVSRSRMVWCTRLTGLSTSRPLYESDLMYRSKLYGSRRACSGIPAQEAQSQGISVNIGRTTCATKSKREVPWGPEEHHDCQRC
jgi:hypothetical protein